MTPGDLALVRRGISHRVIGSQQFPPHRALRPRSVAGDDRSDEAAAPHPLRRRRDGGRRRTLAPGARDGLSRRCSGSGGSTAPPTRRKCSGASASSAFPSSTSRRRPRPNPRSIASYLALQGDVVPMIDDDGFVLFEGNAIARYLAETYGRAPFWPATAKGRAAAGRWMDYPAQHLTWVSASVDARHARPRAHRRACPGASPTDSQWSSAHSSASPYLAGDDFTVGDIPIGIMAFRWHASRYRAAAACRRSRRGIARLRARPAFRQHVEPLPPQGSFTPLEASA